MEAAKSDYDKKTEALKTANDTVTEKQTALDEAQAAYETEATDANKTAVDNAQAALEEAQKKVKAAEDGEYNVGVWFLQDNVYGQQTDYLGIADNSYNYHENCVRSADSRYGNSYAGYPLGEIKAGKTAQRTFVLNIDKETWKLKDMNNLHFAAFVTAKNGKSYQVVNVVDCEISEPTPYEYK